MALPTARVAALMGVLSSIGCTAAVKLFGAQEVGAPEARARVATTAQSCDGSALGATVVRESDVGYNASRSQWASTMSSSAVADARTRPHMIVYCTTDAHVQEAVSFAKGCGFSISVRSGGHNYAGLSSCPEDSPQCIQVDLSGIETFAVNTATSPAQVTIGSGLIMEQVYSMLMPYGLTVPGGTCKTVGVGGHYQSSAAGYLVRSFGLGLDHVKSFRIVLADAQVHVVDESSDPELYWALLGGGPGSWGIVLDYTLDTIAYADAPHTSTWTFLYPYSRAMLHALGSLWSSQMADPVVERDLMLLFMVHPGVLFGFNDTYEHYIMVRGVWTGIDNGALAGSLYTQYVTPFEAIPHLTLAPVTPVPVHAIQGALATSWDLGPFRSHIHGFATKSWPDAVFYDAIADEVEIRLAIPYLHFSFQLWAFGGQGRRNAGQNAYANREAETWVDDWVFFLGDGMAQVAEDRIWAFRNTTGHEWEEDNIPHSWMTPDTLTQKTHSGAADFAMNESWFARLQDVKTRVDSADLFRTSMTIPARGSASAAGDPHLQNIHGERFDLMQPGWHTLLEIPRQAAAQHVLLLVEAEARHDGPACTDMYFRSLNITGEWAEEKQKGGLRFHAHQSDGTASTWMKFNRLDLKVTHGRTLQGTRYLNFFVSHLAKTGFAIGGLLGEDDHTKAATPEASCRRGVSLLQGTSGRAEEGASSASSAEASLA